MIPGMARTPSVELSAADQMRLGAVAVGPPHAAAGRAAVSGWSCRPVRRNNYGHRFCLWSQPPYLRTVAGAGLEAWTDAVWETQAGRGRKPQYDPGGPSRKAHDMAKAPRREQRTRSTGSGNCITSSRTSADLQAVAIGSLWRS